VGFGLHHPEPFGYSSFHASRELNAGATSGGSYENGANGAAAGDADFIGTIDPNDDTPTGLKCFEDVETVDVNIIAAPMDNISRGVMQELNRVAKKVNAMALADVPAGLNARLAIDWHNGQGQFTGLGRIDSPNIAVYWNWFNITDPFTGTVKLVPPTLGALRCLAFTFDRDKPWYAAAGENRGWIPEALSVEFDRVSGDVKQAMYGNGNSVNPILKTRGRILLYGERTMQVAESKLTAVHNVILVNFVVNGLAAVGRKYVFDPNDAELLTLINLSFSEFLDKVKNERGIEDYNLVIDDRNNNAATRNQKQVIVDLAIIPTDVAERIFINATVKESGAVLNALNA
jgi:phage tail sheath protein FI